VVLLCSTQALFSGSPELAQIFWPLYKQHYWTLH
jgi:hypothetical protein